ncbi:MAG: cation transporter [Methanobrevibacter sp.]|nr:cation transporter [Methanobrevibacter sp.]
MNREERDRLGKRASTVAIVGNIILTVLNITVGLMSGSYALISEGAHTISDIATSVIAYAGFRIGSKPADKEHPLGHGRAEAISGLVIVVFLSIVAIEVIQGAFQKLFFGGALEVPDPIAVVMAFIGILINLFMSQYIIRLGEKARSPAIVADGKHQRVDIFASLAIFIGIMVSQYGYPMLDPIIGIFIGALIARTAIYVAIDNLNNIMGKLPSNELIEEIRENANSVAGVCRAHDIKVNYFGSYATVSLHVELPPEMSLDEAHKLTHLVQNKILENVDMVQAVNVHPCPYGLKYDHSQLLDEES